VTASRDKTVDHLHALISFSPNAEISGAITEWKKFTARTLNIQSQRDFFDHRLRSDESAKHKQEYIRQNPVRAGLGTKAEDWPYVWWPTAG
jgi:putative transposase